MKPSTSATSSLLEIIDSKSSNRFSTSARSKKPIVEVESRQQQERMFSIQDAEECVLQELYDGKQLDNYGNIKGKEPGKEEGRGYLPVSSYQTVWSWELGWKESSSSSATGTAANATGKDTRKDAGNTKEKERMEKLKRAAKMRLDAILKQLN